MGRIRTRVIVEDNQLLIFRTLDDLRRACRQFFLHLTDDRQDERCQQGEHENANLVLDLLDKIGQDWNLVNGLRDGLHELIVELHDRVDLLC